MVDGGAAIHRTRALFCARGAIGGSQTPSFVKALSLETDLTVRTGDPSAGIRDTDVPSTDLTAFASAGLAGVGDAGAVLAGLPLRTVLPPTRIGHTNSIFAAIACATGDLGTGVTTGSIAAELVGGALDPFAGIGDAFVVFADLTALAALFAGLGDTLATITALARLTPLRTGVVLANTVDATLAG